MSVYFDASVLVSMWVADAHSSRVDRWIASLAEPVLVSGWAMAEFSSALGRQQRTGALDASARRAAEQALDAWMTSGVERMDIAPPDYAMARQLLRADTHPLRAPDALHIAASLRLGAMLATLDRTQRSAAAAIGVATAPLEPS